jgi:hypothetical protein
VAQLTVPIETVGGTLLRCILHEKVLGIKVALGMHASHTTTPRTDSTPVLYL